MSALLLSPFFDWLVRCSVQASILVVLILVLRFVFRRRVDARWLCLLWLVLLLRLSLPTAPSSRLSLFNLLPGSEPTAPRVVRPAEAVADTPAAKPELSALTDPTPAATPVHAAAHWQPSGRTIVELIWLAGAALLAIGTVAVHLCFLRQIHRAKRIARPAALRVFEQCRQDMGVTRSPLLVESAAVRAPTLVGLMRPRLAMPVGMAATLRPDQLRHIFLHELAHLKRHDLAAGWAMAVLQALHWFNPLIWLAFRQMRVDRELACDALALSKLPPSEPRAYGETLLHLLERMSGLQRTPVLATGLFEATSDLKGRITMIGRYRQSSMKRALCGLAILVPLGCATLTDAQAPGAKADLSKDSRIDEHGRIVDRTDYPFVNDEAAVGKWESVDFVKTPGDFKPGAKHWKGDLFLKGFTLLPKGRMQPGWWHWTKGLIMHDNDQTAGAYTLKEMDGQTYMIWEWKSGDYSIRHQKPEYYVLKKVSSDAGPAADRWAKLPSDEAFGRTLQGKIDALPKGDITPDDIIKAFGQPGEYVWGEQSFSPDKLPRTYIMAYPAEFSVMVSGGKVDELRIHKPYYKLEGKLQVGSNVDEVLKVLGEPRERVKGKECKFANRVLYEDMDGHKGLGYYQVPERHVRLFLMDGKVSALYLTRPHSESEGAMSELRTSRPGDEAFNKSVSGKVAKFDLDKATLEDVIKVFGEPRAYAWENQVVSKDKLGKQFVMVYTPDFTVFMSDGRIVELRFEGPGTDYAFDGKIKVGSGLEEAIKVVGPPKETVKGQKNEWKDRVLYLDMNGQTGWGYYAAADRHVRMFFQNGKVRALYVTR